MLKSFFDRFVADGFDELGAFVNVIDGFLAEERFQPTVELLEALGYQRVYSAAVGENEYSISGTGSESNEKSCQTAFFRFQMGKLLIQYQPLNRCILRGKNLATHRPESDFRFADWYPVKDAPVKAIVGKIEDQLADDFPNAATAAQFLFGHGFARSNTHKRLPKNTYFVAARHGDGQPSGIVFRSDGHTFFYDYYSDARYLMGASGLLKDLCDTERQFSEAMSLATAQMPLLKGLE